MQSIFASIPYIFATSFYISLCSFIIFFILYYLLGFIVNFIMSMHLQCNQLVSYNKFYINKLFGIFFHNKFLPLYSKIYFEASIKFRSYLLNHILILTMILLTNKDQNNNNYQVWDWGQGSAWGWDFYLSIIQLFFYFQYILGIATKP